jgi:hypothetical protein
VTGLNQQIRDNDRVSDQEIPRQMERIRELGKTSRVCGDVDNKKSAQHANAHLSKIFCATGNNLPSVEISKTIAREYWS